MRKNKFRAWDTEKKIMHLPSISEVSMDFEGLIYYKNRFRPEYQDRFIIIQFTGFKDKNKVEIYEGDLVKFTIYDGKEGIIKEVKLNKHMDYGSLFILECEVIGNIYENPELLEKVEE